MSEALVYLRRAARTAAARVMLGAVLAAAGGCSAGASRSRAQLAEQTPVRLDRPLDGVAADFRRLIRTYVTVDKGAQDIVIEIEPVDNSVVKELSTDVSPLVRAAVEKVSGPFRTIRAWVDTPINPGFLRSRPAGRPADYRITGKVVEGADASVVGGDLEVAGMTKRPSSDAGVKRGTRRSTRTVQIALTLEDAAGEAIPGASVTYQVTLGRLELNRSFSVYIAGNGFSWGNDRTHYQDPAAVVQDALTMAVTHLLGNAFLVPYWRISPDFTREQQLVDRFQSSLKRRTCAELEHLVKGYLELGGWAMDVSASGFTATDKALATTAMRRLSINPADPDALEMLASDLWSTLDFKTAGPLLERRIDAAVREMRTAAAAPPASAAQPVEWHLSPREFDWHSSTHIVVVDMSRVADESVRRRVAAVVQRVRGAAEVRRHPLQALLGVRDIANAGAIQSALRLSGLPLEYRWLTDSKGQEYLVLRSASR